MLLKYKLLRTAHICSAHIPTIDDVKGRACNAVCQAVEPRNSARDSAPGQHNSLGGKMKVIFFYPR